MRTASSLMSPLSVLPWLVGLMLVTAPALGQSAPPLTVSLQEISDRKAVFATVESADTQVARARIGGTLGEVKAGEGNWVEAGQLLATVGDPKLLLQEQSSAARIQSLKAERAQAAIDLSRAEQLFRQGVLARAKLDQARTAVEVYDRNITAAEADRNVVRQQTIEGAILAPRAGRILEVTAKTGSVLLPGEAVATIATGGYLLRMEVPERHARFIAKGDTVLVGPRGVDHDISGAMREGKVTLVYPQIKNGRVVADITVEGLGDYFVGERTIVWVNAGSRKAFVIPKEYLSIRFGVTFATLKTGVEVPVQTGGMVDGGVEVLAGLHDGDTLVIPASVATAQ